MTFMTQYFKTDIMKSYKEEVVSINLYPVSVFSMKAMKNPTRYMQGSITRHHDMTSVIVTADLLYSGWRQDLGFDMCRQQARSP